MKTRASIRYAAFWAAVLSLAFVAKAHPNWQGGTSTEWGDHANWVIGTNGADLSNGFWIDPWQGATSFAMTFNRDGTSYASDDANSAYKGTDSYTSWDLYNIWDVKIRYMTNDLCVTWTASDDSYGPHIRNYLGIGTEATRGALAINGGTVTLTEDGNSSHVRLGWGTSDGYGNTGELTINGGLLETKKGILMAKDSAWRAMFNLYGGTYKNDWQYYGNESGVGNDWATFIRGNGDVQFHFDGGTIKAAGARQGFGVDGATFGANGLTFNTDGNTVVLHETGNATIVPDANVLTKQGDGTLVVDAMPAQGTVAVEGGTLQFATDGNRSLVHRWSFTSDATDSITGASATEETNVTYSDGVASLSGGDKGTSCINLGANLWPTNAMTLEIWANYRERTSWAKLFCWSGMQYSFQDDGGWSKFSLLGTGGTDNLEATGGNIEAGSTNCYTFVFIPNGAGGTHIRMCCWDATTGELLNSRDYDGDGWLISQITQENFYLGRSYWDNPDAKADYDEVRIWTGVFADTELREHVLLGPDTLPGANGAENTLNTSASSDIVENDYLLHRWTFNNTLQDLIGGTTATLRGDAAYNSSRTAIRLPGGSRGAGWIDLGENGGFPTNDTPFTIEFWTTVHEYTANRRIFSMGKRPSGDAWDESTDSVASLYSGIHTYFADDDGSGKYWRATTRKDSEDNATLSGEGWFITDVEYHCAITFVPDSESGNTAYYVYAYRADDGGSVGTFSGTASGWLPSCVNDVAGSMCCWLGHSQWSDDDANATFNEFRIWNCALSAEQLAINRKLGPDKLPELTMINKTRAFAAEVASGAIMDLGGNEATLTSLAGAGTVQNGSVTVTGEVSPEGSLTVAGDLDVDGTITLASGETLAVGGALDLSGATINLDGEWTVSQNPITAEGGITGTPTLTGDYAKRFTWRTANDGKTGRLSANGFMLIIK